MAPSGFHRVRRASRLADFPPQGVDAFAPGSDHGHRGQSHACGERLDIDLDAFLGGDIDHVDCDDYRNVAFQQLLGQHEAAFQGGTVDHIDEQVAFAVVKEFPGDLLVDALIVLVE